MSLFRSKADLKEFILRRLGGGKICVELTDAQLDDAVSMAEQWWQSWVGVCKAVRITLSDRTEYTAESIASDIDSIVDVVFDVDDNDLTKVFDWAGVDINPYTYIHSGVGDYGSIVQYMQYREMGKQVVSSDTDWAWIKERRLLVITPKPGSGTHALVIYLSTNFDYGSISSYEAGLFRDYAMAQAMKTLALIRSKFADKPGAVGSFALDGDALWANAEAMEAQAEEKMRLMQHPVPFIAV